MFSRKKQSKSVIKITDTQISYISISKKNNLFHVDTYDTIDIPEGIIKNGEILKANIFSQKIKDIKKTLENKEVDVLLPHDLFLCHGGILNPKTENQTPTKRVKNYLNNFSQIQPWQKSRVCDFETFNLGKKDHVVFTCLQKDIQKSYLHVFKKSGLTISSINSDILAFGHLFSDDQSSVILVGDRDSRVIDFDNGMYVGHTTFHLSYTQFLNDIMKNASITPEQALKILKKYGVLRTHKDEQVYTRIHRSLDSLLDYFKKKKTTSKSNISLIYSALPIQGFADELSYSATQKVRDFNIFDIKEYSFTEILSLPKKDSYYYQSHIAQALRFWKK